MPGYLRKIRLPFNSFSTAVFSALFLTFSIFNFYINASPTYAQDVSVSANPSYFVDKEGHLTAVVEYQFNSSSSKVVSYYTANIPFIGIKEVILGSGTDFYETTLFEKQYSTDVIFVLKNLSVPSDTPRSLTLSFKVEKFVDVSSSFFAFPIAYSKTAVDELTLTVDKEVGLASLASVQSASSVTKDSAGNVQFIFTKPSAESVVVLIGTTTSYDFKISQEFENSSTTTQHFEIPIPLSDKRNTVLINSINADSTTRKDTLGNTFVGFDIPAGGKYLLEINGEIISQNSLDSNSTELPGSAFLSINSYWQIENSIVNNVVEPLGLELSISNDKLQYSNVEYSGRLTAVHKFVMGRLSVAESKTVQNSSGQAISTNTLATRAGAQVAYETKIVDSVNYADLTTALLRAQGIPTRMVVGYVKPIAPNLKQGFLHSWTEAWSSDQGWIILDPAYEEITKQNGIGLNLSDHVPLFIRDSNPVKPTLGLLNDAAIDVNYSKVPSSGLFKPGVEITAEVRNIYERGVEIEVKITNTGNIGVTDAFIEINGIKQRILESKSVVLPGQVYSNSIVINLADNQILNNKLELNYKVEFYSENRDLKSADGSLTIEAISPWWWDYLFVSLSVTIPLLMIYIIWGLFNSRKNH